jgi:hypothetical protein
VKLPAELLVEQAKITDYLLMWKAENDKSAFLRRLGYTEEEWETLAEDIRMIARREQTFLSRQAPFGGYLYKVIGKLRTFEVVTIWFMDDPASSRCRFVTLYPFSQT